MTSPIKKRLAFIDHSFHKATLSPFRLAIKLSELLKQRRSDLSHQGGARTDRAAGACLSQEAVKMTMADARDRKEQSLVY